MQERHWFGRFLPKGLRVPSDTARTDVELKSWKQVRITIVIGPFYPIPPVLGGAVEKVHLLLAGAYCAAGHDVTIISRRYKDFAGDEVVDGIRHIRVRSTDRRSSLIVNLL